MFYCEFRRNELAVHIDTRSEAEKWLRDIDSEGATITDSNTGAVGRLDLRTLEIVWTEQPHGRERSGMWTRNDPELVPGPTAQQPKAVRSPLRTTHTYAVLDVDKATYDDVQARLRAAGYTHAFINEPGEGTLIDMQGIALRQER